MTTLKSHSPTKRRLLYLLVAVCACAFTITLFYAEEDVRGWQAMQTAKSNLAAEGIILSWSRFIPAPVPPDENVFGVPQMTRWFVGKGSNELSHKLDFPGANRTNMLTVAQLTIGLPGTPAPPGSVVLQWGGKNAGLEIERLVESELGPLAVDFMDTFFYTTQPSHDIRPAQIFLQCQSPPAEKDLQKFLSRPLVREFGRDSYLFPTIVKTSDDSYDVSVAAPFSASDYLQWSDQLQPELAVIRQALQRRYAQFEGSYAEPEECPIPNFVTLRAIAQRTAARAECHLLLGQPDEALRDLTFLNDLCRRTLEDNPVMTLVSAMINVAIRGLCATTIADGVQMHAWREPQLAALQQQLANINVLPPVKKALTLEKTLNCWRLATKTPSELGKLFGMYIFQPRTFANTRDSFLFKLIPRGWVWQNMATASRLSQTGHIDPVNKIVFADTVKAGGDKLAQANEHWSPYSFMALWGVPNFARAYQTTARNQTIIHQTIIACALERYRLAHGAYPENLDALIPQFINAIPHDVVGGQLPRYIRTGNMFTLTSAGWDDKDWVWPE